MSRYSNLRELTKLADALEAEARTLPRNSQSRTDRMAEARGYRVKALWLAGRITREDYDAELRECLDAKTYSIEA